ncbi:hypothetical protein F5Y10DRAFT_268422 [Nemania abortiva]|nr:hypothetical protein F5Y10DRAFT_268422 [Nemania abortiva]
MSLFSFLRKRTVSTRSHTPVSTPPGTLPNSPPMAASAPPAPAYPRSSGLIQVYPDPSQSTKDEEPSVDIVAIHGLDTESSKAWVAWKVDGDPTSGDVHWLKDEDMLPSKVPNARIFTYDWNITLDQGTATNNMLGHADDLLLAMHDMRSGSNGNANRPIIWVASCFGGLLLAKALQRASEEDSKYQQILNSTAGVIFLGTPFQGNGKSSCSAADLRITIALSEGTEANGELVKYLREDTTCGRGELDDIVQRFMKVVSQDSYKFPIVCFYETRKTQVGALVKRINDVPEAFRKTIDSGGWVMNDYQSLFRPQIPGAGKTALASFVVGGLLKRFHDAKFGSQTIIESFLSCLLK